MCSIPLSRKKKWVNDRSQIGSCKIYKQTNGHYTHRTEQSCCCCCWGHNLLHFQHCSHFISKGNENQAPATCAHLALCQLAFIPRECPLPCPDLLFRFSSHIPPEKTTSIGPKCPNTIGCGNKISLCGFSLFPSDHISFIKK